MRFGFAAPAYGRWADPAAVRDLIEAGESLAYDTAWFPDHVAVPEYAAKANLRPPFLEPLAAIAWALGVTDRIVFGTDVLVAPYRHPLTVASMAGTLARLAGPRLILGVGVGYLRGEFDALGVPYDSRGAQTDAFLARFRDPPDDVSLLPADTVPLWVGGNNRRAEQRAAVLGDGWHPLWMPAPAYAEARERILASRAEHGRTGRFTFSYSCGATAVLDAPGGPWPAPAPPAPRNSEFSYAPAAWVADDNRPRFVGTPDQVVADLRLLEAAGVEHVTLRFGNADIAHLERFADQVRPAFTG